MSHGLCSLVLPFSRIIARRPSSSFNHREQGMAGGEGGTQPEEGRRRRGRAARAPAGPRASRGQLGLSSGGPRQLGHLRASRAAIQLAGGGPRVAAAGCLGLGGAAHDGEGGGAHGRTRGSSGRRGRGGGKLGPPRPWQAHAQARSGAM